MEEDIDYLAPIDHTKLKIEISVSCGQYHEVSLNTMVQVNAEEKQKSQAFLRDIITMLRNSMPLTELQGADRTHMKDKEETDVDKSGNVSVRPVGFAKASGDLERLKQSLKPEGTDGAASPEPT